jgi:hypothetical protein
LYHEFRQEPFYPWPIVDLTGRYVFLNGESGFRLFDVRRKAEVAPGETLERPSPMLFLSEGPRGNAELRWLDLQTMAESIVVWGPAVDGSLSRRLLLNFARNVEVFEDGRIVIRKPDNLGTDFYTLTLDSSGTSVPDVKMTTVNVGYANYLREDLYIGVKEISDGDDSATVWTPMFVRADGSVLAKYPEIKILSYGESDKEARNLYVLSPDKRDVLFFGDDPNGVYDPESFRKLRDVGLVWVYRILYGDEVGMEAVSIAPVGLRAMPDLNQRVLRTVRPEERMRILERTTKRVKVNRMECYWYRVQLPGGQTGWLLGKDIDILSEEEARAGN